MGAIPRYFVPGHLVYPPWRSARRRPDRSPRGTGSPGLLSLRPGWTTRHPAGEDCGAGRRWSDFPTRSLKRGTGAEGRTRGEVNMHLRSKRSGLSLSLSLLPCSRPGVRKRVVFSGEGTSKAPMSGRGDQRSAGSGGRRKARSPPLPARGAGPRVDALAQGAPHPPAPSRAPTFSRRQQVQEQEGPGPGPAHVGPSPAAPEGPGPASWFTGGQVTRLAANGRPSPGTAP